ncbi:MAG TPA: hypothetical protein VLH61_00130 [Bacteroidales bacterium]|nr:hypothetical protein [Bacteroidales bacterium]
MKRSIFFRNPGLLDYTDLRARTSVKQTSLLFRKYFFWIKNLVIFILPAIIVFLMSCEKEETETPFQLITTPVWVTDSLLVNGMDASGPGQVLANFKGEAKFNKDGTGQFGIHTGTWRFAHNETQLVITTPAFPIPITTIITELTRTSLKINTEVPDQANPGQILRIRMTFKAR